MNAPSLTSKQLPPCIVLPSCSSVQVPLFKMANPWSQSSTQHIHILQRWAITWSNSTDSCFAGRRGHKDSRSVGVLNMKGFLKNVLLHLSCDIVIIAIATNRIASQRLEFWYCTSAGSADASQLHVNTSHTNSWCDKEATSKATTWSFFSPLSL